MTPSVRVILGASALAAVVLAVSFLTPAATPKTERLAERPVAATPTPTPPLDPLQIEAMRARDYPASELKVVRELGDQGGYTETVSSFQSDGLTQYALVSTPAGPKPAGGWPVVILAHGYINPTTYRTDSANYAGFISTLARAGYLVIKPDYRGHGESQGDPAGGHYSPGYAYDILNLISTVKKYPEANASRIGLVGHSMGGHEALRAIVVSKDIKATVFLAGVVGSMTDLMYNWPRSPVLHDQPAALVRQVRQGLLDKYGTPATNPTFWDSASAINYVSNISGAVQIHHAVADNMVPKLFSDHLNQALIDAHMPVEYYTYQGNDHQLAYSRTRALVTERMLAFFAAHL